MNTQYLYGMSIFTSPKIRTATKAKDLLLEQTDECGFAVVHCQVDIAIECNLRIWPSTFLIPAEGGCRCKLVHCEGISFFPEWQLAEGPVARFTLYFEGLPKGCRTFDLVEIIPEPGGFESRNIVRNASDVYRVSL